MAVTATGQFIPDQLGPPPGIVQTGPTFAAANDPVTGAPPTGLIGAEQELRSSSNAALGALRNARNQSVRDLRQAGQQGVEFLGQGIEGFQPFAQQGQGAGDVQAALSGALGVPAQQEALANLQPVNDFLFNEGSRAVTRSAARLGGLGGGNVQRELTRFGQGLAGQSAQQQFQNLGTVANRGFDALQSIGSLRGRQADTLGRTAQDITSTRANAATNIANVFGGTGGAIAAGRTRAGEQIAGAVGGTTSALADLANAQGGGLSDITGTGASNLATTLSGATGAESVSLEQLAALLSNIQTGQAGQVAALPSTVFQPPNAVEQVGQVAGGIGSILAALNQK